MPLKIIRQDITKIKCDAIVNPTNIDMFPGGGVDAAIHEAAGQDLLEYCKKIGGCSVGEAKITPAFNLPSKFVIHTVGPEWEGGQKGEKVLLRSCYTEAMKLAIENNCTSVAFPLISSGLYGYPKDRVLCEATDVIREFLERYEMDVYIVVYDKSAYSISKELFVDVQAFIDNYYVETHRDYFEYSASEALPDFRGNISASKSIVRSKNDRVKDRDSQDFPIAAMADESVSYSELAPSFQDIFSNMDKGFADTLFYYIDKKGITDVEAYKRSNVGKKTFSKIKCNKNYNPSKITAVSFAIGLRLNIEETKHLLSTAGLCLSRASKFDVIIEYFIMSGKYETIFDVNEVLYQFDQSLLGV